MFVNTKLTLIVRNFFKLEGPVKHTVIIINICFWLLLWSLWNVHVMAQWGCGSMGYPYHFYVPKRFEVMNGMAYSILWYPGVYFYMKPSFPCNFMYSCVLLVCAGYRFTVFCKFQGDSTILINIIIRYIIRGTTLSPSSSFTILISTDSW